MNAGVTLLDEHRFIDEDMMRRFQSEIYWKNTDD